MIKSDSRTIKRHTLISDRRKYSEKNTPHYSFASAVLCVSRKANSSVCCFSLSRKPCILDSIKLIFFVSSTAWFSRLVPATLLYGRFCLGFKAAPLRLFGRVTSEFWMSSVVVEASIVSCNHSGQYKRYKFTKK